MWQDFGLRGKSDRRGLFCPLPQSNDQYEGRDETPPPCTAGLRTAQLPYLLARCAVDGTEFASCTATDRQQRDHRLPRLRSAHAVPDLHEMWTPLRDAVEGILKEWGADGGRPQGRQKEKDPLPIPPVHLCAECPQHFGDIAVATAPHPCALCPNRYMLQWELDRHIVLTHGGAARYRERWIFERAFDTRPKGVHSGDLGPTDAEGVPLDEHLRALQEPSADNARAPFQLCACRTPGSPTAVTLCAIRAPTAPTTAIPCAKRAPNAPVAVILCALPLGPWR